MAMEYQWQFGQVLIYWPNFLQGILVTLELAACLIVTATIGGIIVGSARHSRKRIYNWPASIFIEVFRNTPVLVQIIWFYYAFPVLIDVQMPGFVAAVLGIGLNSVAYSAEVFRAGIQSIERGQWEAARAIGMQYMAIMRRIILPQAIRRMIPAFANRMIEIFKATSLASAIAVGELLFRGEELANTIYRPMEIYTIVAILFFVLIYPLAPLTYWLEWKLNSKSRRPS
ncbi:amino acid ABC transporter permease [Aquamicrobium soli]|jgi:polar amino acid transport system permease protein|uniref:Amino acid ABC transporter permease n=1 Tax=Aquamicrobium soli TaxID=1811518 RepID=A0ABV7KA72_9HYPH